MKKFSGGIQKISLDFDNVLYDLISIDLERVKKVCNIDLKTSDVTTFGFLKDNFPFVESNWTDFDLYKTASFFEGDREFVNELQNMGFELQIVTSSYDSIIKEKDILLQERYGDIPVIHSLNKIEHTHGTILIDDAIHNIEPHLAAGNKAILVSRDFGWNQKFVPCNNSIILDTFDEILDCLR